MSLAYYPGCTLKTKAKNLEEPAIASMEVLGSQPHSNDGAREKQASYFVFFLL